MIPADKLGAVSRCLRHALGTASIQGVHQIDKGLSADLVFSIEVKGSLYLLKIMTRRDERNDPVRIFACMNAAADAGLAPRVICADADEGISIIDWVEPLPFTIPNALLQVPAVLRRLHALAPFPTAFNYVTAHNYFVWRLLRATLLTQTELEEAVPGYAQICRTYPRVASDLTPCHMDLKPENLLFDGQRLWLIDWMAASMNDRYFDLAIVANFVVAGAQDEQTYLREYFGAAPDEYQLARFFLMRQLLHMLAAAVYLLLGTAGKPIDRREDLPSFQEFHQRIWQGEIDLADNRQKVIYGLIHWRQFLQNLRHPRFPEALRTVAARHPGSPLLLPTPS